MSRNRDGLEAAVDARFAVDAWLAREPATSNPLRVFHGGRRGDLERDVLAYLTEHPAAKRGEVGAGVHGRDRDTLDGRFENGQAQFALRRPHDIFAIRAAGEATFYIRDSNGDAVGRAVRNDERVIRAWNIDARKAETA